MVSTSNPFGKSPMHTSGSNPSITIIELPSNTSHHITWLNGSAMMMWHLPPTASQSHSLVSHHQHSISGDDVCGWIWQSIVHDSHWWWWCEYHPQSHTSCVVPTQWPCTPSLQWCACVVVWQTSCSCSEWSMAWLVSGVATAHHPTPTVFASVCTSCGHSGCVPTPQLTCHSWLVWPCWKPYLVFHPMWVLPPCSTSRLRRCSCAEIVHHTKEKRTNGYEFLWPLFWLTALFFSLGKHAKRATTHKR